MTDTWFKSSHSDDGGGCVEVAPSGGEVGVRDSKDPDGPALWFPSEAWRAFVAEVRDGRPGEA